MNTLKTLPGFGWVIGVTCLDGKLFVLYQREREQLEVYSTKTSEDFKRLDLFTVEGLVGEWHRHNDMTSSPKDKCLYISDHDQSCVHKSAMDGKLIKSLTVPKSPCGLSVTLNNTLLVMCYHVCPETRAVSRKLVELCGKSGTYIRELELQDDTKHPYHAMQLYGDSSTRQCVIAHSCCNDSQSKVAVVDLDRADSRVLQRYAETDTHPLIFVRHVAVDRHNFVFVADEHGGVVVISPSLQFVRCVEVDQRPIPATRLYLDHATRRLYVGRLNGVTIIQL